MAKAKQLKATNGEDKKFTRPILAYLKLLNQLFPSEFNFRNTWMKEKEEKTIQEP